MENKKCFVFFVIGVSGGTATLSYRLSVDLINLGYDVYYVYFINNNKDNIKLLESSHVNMIYASIDKWVEIGKQIVKKYSTSILMAYSFEVFYVLENIKKNRKNTNIYLYDVRYDNLAYGACKPKPAFYHNMLNLLNTSYIKSLYRQNKLLFMDEGCIDTTEKALSITFEKSKDNICRLPYHVGEFPDINKEKRILKISTMLRVAFPFKSYILGLVDIYCELKKKYPKLELDIIGDGPSFKELETKIQATCSEQDINGIHLHGSLPYAQAKNIISGSIVFVGMGTSVLDAVSMGVPSIVVQVHNEECKGDFFANNPNNLGYTKEDQVNIITNHIESVIDLNSYSYIEFCKNQFESLHRIYGCDNFVIKLQNNPNTNVTFFDRFAYLLHHINILITNIVIIPRIKNKDMDL